MFRQTQSTSVLLILSVAIGMAAGKSPATDPEQPLDRAPFDFTVAGKGFDPATVNLVFTGPGCPNEKCAAPNNRLTSKTPNAVSGRIALPAGRFTITVKNGDKALRGRQSLLVAPRLSRIFTYPTRPVRGVAFEFAMDGSGFDPETLHVAIVGGDCPTGGCPVSDADVAFRSPTMIAGRTAVATSGALKIGVRNGPDGLSNVLPLTVGMPQLTRISTYPNPPLRALPFDFVLEGSGFDPVTAVPIVAGAECPGGCATPIEVTFRSPTLVAGRTGVAVAGPHTIAVRNGSDAVSNKEPLTVVPPQVTRIFTHPTPPAPGIAFEFTISGSGFDPIAVTPVAIGPGCPSGGCPLPAQVTFRTPVLVGGQMSLPAGLYHIAVKNGADAPSDSQVLTVVPPRR